VRNILVDIGKWIEDPKTWVLSVLFGIFVFLFYAFPYLLQGENSIIEVHDNLDSDLVWFYLISESPNTFSFSNKVSVDPIMGGELPRNALPPALNGITLLFSLLPPLTAYLTNFLIVRAVGVISMYSFLTWYIFTKPRESAYAIPVAFAYGLLPYHGLHPGIAVSGLPIVALSFANLHQGRRNLLSCLLLVVYGLYSSLLYVGIFVLIIVGTGALWRYLQGYTSRTGFKRVALGGVLLAITYVVAEWNLFNLYFFSDFLAHREEFNYVKLGLTLDALGAIQRGVDHFLNGHYHASSLHNPFIIIGTLGVAGGACYQWYTTGEISLGPQRTSLKWLITTCMVLIFISCIHGLWLWEPFVIFRSGIGLLSKINFNRFYFLAPFLWAFVFAIGIVYVRREWKFLRPAVFLVSVLQLVFVVYSNGQLRSNYLQVMGRETPASPTYEEFYSSRLFDEIKNDIGVPPENYRVVSVGLFPDIAAYNGFYTLDSYQRLYPLEYKHQFRQIIAPELKKNNEIRKYFEYWGSRCYMFSSELGKDYYIPKSEAEPIRVNYNTDALRKMGGKYVLSSVPISNVSENDFSFIDSFENNTSPYKIHLYKVN
jgi:uncharacterized membrane protein YidH (DUF202 family)